MENKYETIPVAKDCVVALRYIMKDSRNEILEDTMDRDPVNYLHGSMGILPILQAQIEGLTTGDKKTIYLTAESGLTNEDFTIDVVIDNVRAASNQEIVLGYPVMLTLQKCEDECVCYNDEI